MDWSKIKTIFILTFLVLNIYLMYEFFKLKDSTSQYEFIVEPSFDKRLKADEIQFDELPKNYQKDNYLSAKPKNFTSDEGLDDPKLKGQQVTVNDGLVLAATLDKPYELSDKLDTSEINSFVKNHVLYGDQYRFWGKDENKITYYQKFKDKVFYKNISGELTIWLNTENNDIVSYQQTMLENIEERSEKEKIIQPLKAIETLYEKGSLKPKSKISKVELGYVTFIHTGTSQVLTPAWRFVINDEENLFVHAIEGQIMQLNNEEKKIVE
ncbi:two-component system regulatory protein YycI [Cytobacillus praedii]|uniref:two-component system regulatory protein YycI n=1 Tax=Cytobacillus praedii TaxID=1742358 RepID=UPI002E1CB484|nr:two-component system regulatory protein YycI [Cytobacillus praedii]MED3570965.1 two-component system regulatory protein YycI [Cytobacillus praedii]